MTTLLPRALGDAAVIGRSLSEPERFSELFDAHATVIHRYAARRLGPDLADDIVSETFLSAFESRRRYDQSRADARPWLFGIASNHIGKHRRTEIALYKAYVRSGVHPAEPGAEERADTLAANRPLAQALLALEARDRDVLLLVAWAELSYGEVADALKIPVGTVRSRLSRARKKVREWMS